MLKNLFALNILFFSVFCLPVAAQDETFDPFRQRTDSSIWRAGKKKTDQELYNEGKRKYERVLLVPYNPDMHLPDPAGDAELVNFSGKDYNTLRQEIRTSLDFQIAEKIKPNYKIVPLLRQNTMDARNDLEMIYGAAGYKYEKSKRAKEAANASMTTGKKIAGKLENLTKPKPHEQPVTKGELTVDTSYRDMQYMNMSFSNMKIIPYLANRYGADLFVFISQVEIKKCFGDAADVPYRDYSRAVKVHYSVLDREGKQLAGDVAIARIPIAVGTKTDDIKLIMDATFPLISGMIVNDLPKPDMSTPEKKLEKEGLQKAAEQDLIKKKN